jgi:hypothetical protein
MPDATAYIVVDALEHEIAEADAYVSKIKDVFTEIASNLLPFKIPFNFTVSVYGNNLSNVVHSALHLLNKYKDKVTPATWQRYSDYYKNHVLSFPITKGASEHKRQIRLTQEMIELIQSIGDYIQAHDIYVYRSHSGGKPSRIIISTIALFYMHDFLLKVKDKPGLLGGENQWSVDLGENLQMTINICIEEKKSDEQ